MIQLQDVLQKKVVSRGHLRKTDRKLQQYFIQLREQGYITLLNYYYNKLQIVNCKFPFVSLISGKIFFNIFRKVEIFQQFSIFKLTIIFKYYCQLHSNNYGSKFSPLY